MKIFSTLLVVPLLVTSTATIANAQTERAVERRADRVERRAERQLERANYFNDEAWGQLSPWINENRGQVQNDLNRAQRAAENAADTAARAANLERASDRIDQRRGEADVDVETDANARLGADDDQELDADFQQRGNFLASDTRRNETHGYVDATPQDERWFYDYYTLVPTYSPSTLRLADVEDIDLLGDVDVSERVTVAGSVVALKKAKVEDKINLLVKLDSTREDVDVVDLGPADEISSLVNIDSEIRATGWTETIGDKTVLVARKVMVDNESINIRRNFRHTIDGEVVAVRKVIVAEGDNHYVAMVEADDRFYVVDLGPTTEYTVDIVPRKKIEIVGVPVRTNDEVILMARKVELEGIQTDIVID